MSGALDCDQASVLGSHARSLSDIAQVIYGLYHRVYDYLDVTEIKLQGVI